MAVYAAHILFWLVFGAANLYARLRSGAAPPPASASAATTPNATAPLRAPNASLLVAVHMVAFGVMYFAVGKTVLSRTVPFDPSSTRAIVGAALIASGAVLAFWARVSFASWRIRAQLDAGHQLATGGPFRVIRNPIYLALNLLALGTAIWVSGIAVWIALLLTVLGGELRARAEEPLLERAFGDEYREYRKRTWRFVPGVY
jgi:protein-S-isoprenylcysteine O-methyltransferase Ste14